MDHHKNLYYCTFSTAYNKFALHDAHAGHTQAVSQAMRAVSGGWHSPKLQIMEVKKRKNN